MILDSDNGVLPDHSVDAFLGGRITLLQPLKGHRAGLDAALLQALVPADACGRAVDLGTGAGTVAFCIAARAPHLSVIGVERERELAACARAALERPENAGFGGRDVVRDSAEIPAASSEAQRPLPRARSRPRRKGRASRLSGGQGSR